MDNKVILISIDGMRPDGFLQCAHPFVQQMLKEWSYTLTARSVSPSITLPCHTSIFYSVPPTRHGIFTNLYTPPVRPVKGLAESLAESFFRDPVVFTGSLFSPHSLLTVK